jgi:hypothetical protein
MKASLRALNLVESAGIGATATFMPLFANSLTSSYILVGAIYATNAITQFVFMNWYGRTIHANYYRSIEIGAILSAAVFLAYFLSQSYFHMFLIQVVLGLSWSLLYMGSLLYLLDKNKEKATSSALPVHDQRGSDHWPAGGRGDSRGVGHTQRALFRVPHDPRLVCDIKKACKADSRRPESAGLSWTRFGHDLEKPF